MILVGTDDGIYRWYEGGPWLTFHGLQGRAIVDLVATGGGIIAAIDDAGRVWETEDNGQSWRSLPAPSGPVKATKLAIGGEPARLIVAGRTSHLLSRPIGAPLPPAPRWFKPLLERGRQWGGRSGRGSTVVAAATAPARNDSAWTEVRVPAPNATVANVWVPGDGPWFVSVKDAGLWRSGDSGASWARCEGLSADVLSLRALAQPAGGLVAGTSDGCWMSSDGGATWADHSQGLEDARYVRVVEPRPDNPKHLLAGAAPGTPRVAPVEGLGYALFESKDGGKSWARPTKGFPARLQFDTIDDIRWDPAAPGFAILAFGSGECWRTRSGGDWWEPIARQTQAARVLHAIR